MTTAFDPADYSHLLELSLHPMHPDRWQVPAELMPYLEWFAAVCDDEPAPAIVDLSPDALEPFPARGICPHCGSQGCPHCADTDVLEVLPPNDDDALPVPPNPNDQETWEELIECYMCDGTGFRYTGNYVVFPRPRCDRCQGTGQIVAYIPNRKPE